MKEPTCFKNPDNPSCIDLFITNKFNSFQSTITVSTGLSDFHKMAVTVLKTTFKKVEPKEITYRNYKSFDKTLFTESLKKALSEQCIDSYKKFHEVFMSTLDCYAPEKKKLLRSNEVPYMTKTLRKAIMKRSELATKYHKYKTLQCKTAYKKQRNFVSRLYKKEKKKFYQNLDLTKITDNKQFWHSMQPLFSDKVKTKGKITLVKKTEVVSEDGKREKHESIISNDNEVAKELNTFFENAVKTLEVNKNTYLMNQTFSIDPIMRAIEKFEVHPSILKIKEKVSSNGLFNFQEVQIDDVMYELSQLNFRKANRVGDIPSKHLQQSSEVCGEVLLPLINASIKNGDFPQELKIADVTPTFKKGDATDVSNYRPISVLPSVSKIYERIIQRQILHYMDRSLSSFLCGYRKGYNTQYALISLIERWKKSLDSHGYAGAVLMDLSKAFDTLNHELLIAKLHAYGFSREALKLVYSYLTDRWQRTKINNSFSSWTELLLGVPQGSVLGPILFNIYINDLFWINELTSVCNFADDTTLYACNQDLESVLQRLEHDSLLAIEWFESNFMKLNADKCHLLISGFRHQSHWCKIGDAKIWESSKQKLLGVTIDNRFKFDSHLEKICKETSKKISALGRISNLLPLNKRKLLFNTFIKSQFAYCPLVWMFHDRGLQKRINSLHKRALRIVYDDDQSNFEELLKKDGGFTMHEINVQTLAIEVYKYKKGISPDFMKDIFSDRTYVGPALRSQTDILIPRTNSVHNGDDSLRHLGPLIWNVIPKDIKNLPTLKRFKTEIRKWRPVNCPCRLCKLYVEGIGYLEVS